MKKQQASFRSGWQSENLARFILSKFSFVAQPSTVSDDIGSDFFCTLFYVQKEGRHKYLNPKSSFAIQIKSSMRDTDISNKWEYLANLEIPFFLGLIDRQGMELTMYSGEYIQPFFVEVQTPQQLRFELCQRGNCEEWYVRGENDSFALKFPQIAQFRADMGSDALVNEVHALERVCKVINKNITTRNNKEYIFSEYDSTRLIIPFDNQNVRVSLFNRFGKLHSELAWLLKRRSDIFNTTELEYYNELLCKLTLPPNPGET